ncbi:MAG: O-antigen ligase family protein [Candidatus Caenarcaniphilales bacterium]|nr:O-antigen ligase family protein [Candidatus Caenarcaniphilales bacterium]
MPKFNEIKETARLLSFYCLIAFSVSLFVSITVSAVFFVLGIAFWLSTCKFWNPKLNILNWSVLIWAVIQFSISFIHGGFENILSNTKDTFQMFVPWFWITSLLASIKRKRLRILTQSLIIIGSIVGVLVVFQSQGLFVRSDRGPSGFLYQPMTTSGLLLLTTAISLNFTMLLKRAKVKILTTFYLLLTALQAFSNLVIGQRSILLATFVGFVLWLFLNFKTLGFKSILNTFVLSSFSLLMAYYSSDKLRTKVSSLFHIYKDKVGLGCRLEVWKQNLISFWKEPFVGSGKPVIYNCFGDILGHAHNIYINQLVSYGLVGFLPLINFFVGAIIRLLKRKNRSAFIVAFVAILIHGCFETWWGDSEITSAFWVFLALGLV